MLAIMQLDRKSAPRLHTFDSLTPLMFRSSFTICLSIVNVCVWVERSERGGQIIGVYFLYVFAPPEDHWGQSTYVGFSYECMRMTVGRKLTANHIFLLPVNEIKARFQTS